jgi:drug/metabolite transporter (DMT)-like permease
MLELQLRTWDIYSATAARQACAAIVLFFMLWIYDQRFPLRRDLPWGRLWILGLIGFAGSSFLVTLAVYLSDGVSAAIISATNPISAALTARLLYRVPLERGIVIGAALAVCGGILSAVGGGSRLGEFGLGEWLIVVTNVIWTWYSLAAQHWLRGFTQIHITGLTVVPGALAMVAVTAFVGAVGWVELRIDLSLAPVLVTVYGGAINLAIGNALWHFGVNRIGVNIASMYNNLIPLVAVLFGAWLGQLPTVWQFVGGIVIVGSVLYAQVSTMRSQAAAPRS